MIILVDADGVLENLTEVFPELINEKYGTDIKYEDITVWGFEKYFPNLTYEEVYSTEFDPELYERTKPKKNAPEFLKKLIDDGVHNLIGGYYAKILFEAPWNKNFDTEANGMFRAKNWKEIYSIINTISKQKEFERSN